MDFGDKNRFVLGTALANLPIEQHLEIRFDRPFAESLRRGIQQN